MTIIMQRISKQFLMRLSTVLLFTFLAALGVLFSVYLVISANSLYMYLVAFCFILLALISGFFNIATSYWYYRSYFYDAYLREIRSRLKPLTHFPAVAIAMPVFNESPEVVEKNMLRLMDMNYPKNKLVFYLLDDSTSDEVKSRLSKFSSTHGIRYIHRESRKGFKAGALNNMLRESNEDYVAIFDYDEYLTNINFLKDTLPYFADEELSYIQTTKRYAKGTFFSDTVALFDAFFFRFVQPARALNNTAIFAGSCGIIRKASLDKIGGFPEYIIEDTFFSFESDLSKFKSLYVPKVYALGAPVTNFSQVAKQQWRYNYGDTQFLMYFFSRKRNGRKTKPLSPLSNMDYMTHGFGFNYLSIIVIMFTLTSILVVYSSNPIAHITPSQIFSSKYINFDLELFGISAFLFSFLTPVILTKIYFGSFKKGFMVFMINFALAFIRSKAAFSAVLNRTPKAGWIRARLGMDKKAFIAARHSFVEILFSILLLILGGFAIVIDNFSGGLWLLWYGMLYSTTFYFFYKYG